MAAAARFWGNYAEGGVVNVITREPTTQGGFVDGGGGSYGPYRGSGYGAHVPEGIMKIQGFGSVYGTGGFQQVPDTTPIINGWRQSSTEILKQFKALSATSEELSTMRVADCNGVLFRQCLFNE